MKTTIILICLALLSACGGSGRIESACYSSDFLHLSLSAQVSALKNSSLYQSEDEVRDAILSVPSESMRVPTKRIKKLLSKCEIEDSSFVTLLPREVWNLERNLEKYAYFSLRGPPLGTALLYLRVERSAIVGQGVDPIVKMINVSVDSLGMTPVSDWAIIIIK